MNPTTQTQNTANDLNSVNANALTAPVTKASVPTPTAPNIPSYTSNLVDNITRDTNGYITAQTEEAKKLNELQNTYGTLASGTSLGDLYKNTQQQYGVTPETLQQLKDVQLQLNTMNTNSDVAKTDIAGAAGQTYNQGQREVTQQDRENAVRSAGLAARAAVLQGNIDTANAAAKQAVDIAYQDRTLKNQNMLQQINFLQTKVDSQTAQLLEQEKRQYTQDLAKVQEVKDAITAAVTAGASSSEIAQLNDPTIPDAKKIAMAQSISARTGQLDRQLKQSQLYTQSLTQQKTQQEIDAVNNQYKGEFSSLIENAANLVGSAKGATSKVAIGNALKSGDYSSAYALIANNVEDSLTGTNKTKFADARTDYNVMSGLKDAIQAYAAAGGDTGLLTGKAEQISRNLLGVSGNPELTKLAVQLEREFQSYRQNMTGAAFTPQESREYASVNPRTTASLDLNLATIDGAMSQLENRITSTVDARVPGASALHQVVSGNTTDAHLTPDQAYQEYLKQVNQ